MIKRRGRKRINSVQCVITIIKAFLNAKQNILLNNCSAKSDSSKDLLFFKKENSYTTSV